MKATRLKIENILFSFSFLMLFLIQSCTNGKIEQEYIEDNFDSFCEEFKNPKTDFAPAPLFVWNTNVTKEELKVQLTDLKDKGFGGVFVHPRPGMLNEYLSENWFDLFDFTMQQCEELGLEVWIYDENSYPSGFAGGYVPEQMPSSYNEGQGLKGQKASRLHEGISTYELILKKNKGKWENISEERNKYINKEGGFYLFEKTYYKNSPWYGGFTYVDLLKPGVTEKFIDITLNQGYEKYFPEDLGKQIKGVFSDEPGIFAPDNNSIRWTPDLFNYFQQECGYDLKLHLPSIYEETGDWRKVRYDYYKTLLRLFIDRWAKPMYNYCEEHDLDWTGHYWEHEWPDPYQGPDNMAMYAWQQQPAIDMLFNDFNETRYNEMNPNHWPQAQFGNIRAVKELSSVANQLGKERALSESYGGSGWEFTFNDMKRFGDWQYALGVNFMCQHLAYMSVKGARKYDYPPSFSYHEPWWENYKYLNDYFARLSFALSSGEQVNKILVIEPTSSAWMYAARGKVTDEIVAVGKEFHLFIAQIEKQQVEYDLGSEEIINEFGSVSNDGLVVGERTYEVVVIPPGCETLDAKTIELLKLYLEKGGKLIDFGSLNFISGKETPETIKELKAFSTWNSVDNGEKYNLRDWFFDDWNVVEYDNTKGKLYHQRRELSDGQLLFTINSDRKEKASGTFELNGECAVELDPFTGKVTGYPVTKNGKGKIQIKVDLEPSESLLLYVLNEERKGIAAFETSKEFRKVESNSSLVITATDKNVLAIDFCDLKLRGEEYKDLHVLEATDKVFKAHGFKAGNPWNTMVQFRSETLKRDTFPKGTGFNVTYNVNIEKGVDFSQFEAVVENLGKTSKVKINGNPVESIPEKWWLDRSFKVYSIGKYLNEGKNKLEIIVNPMNVMAEIEPIYILGDFNLQSITKGWKLIPQESLAIGSWKEQGWPFYPASVDYQKTFLIEGKGNFQIRLGNWNGTLSEILVNGSSAGIIYGKLNTLDVSDFIKPGENIVVARVVGSNKNLIGPFHGNLPVGLASPSQWRNIKTYPSGEHYQQLDYGLFETFNLEKEVN